MRTWYKYLMTPDAALAGGSIRNETDELIDLGDELDREGFLARRRNHELTVPMLEFVRRMARKSDRMISVAAGNGEHEIHLILNGYDILVTDIAEEPLGILASRFPEAKTARLDILRPNFEDSYPEMIERFDIAFVPGLFYWLGEADARTAIRNIERLVRPGGKLLVAFRSRNSPITWFIDVALLRWERHLARWYRARKTGERQYSYKVFAGYRRSLAEFRREVEASAPWRFISVSFGGYSLEFHRSAVLRRTRLDRCLGRIFGRLAAHINLMEFVKSARGDTLP